MSVLSAELAAALVSSVAALISVVSTFFFRRQMDRESQAHWTYSDTLSCWLPQHYTGERDSESALLWDHVEAVIHAFSSSDPALGHNSFMIWRGTQAAIGEETIIHNPIDNMPRCVGYSTFCSLIKEKPFLKELVEDTEKMLRSHTSEHRLTVISERLIPLAELLDPKQVYFKHVVRPAESRTSSLTQA